jgi:hypothetical protein
MAADGRRRVNSLMPRVRDLAGAMLGQLRSASVVAAVQNGVQCTASFPNPRFFGNNPPCYLRKRVGDNLSFELLSIMSVQTAFPSLAYNGLAGDTIQKVINIKRQTATKRKSATFTGTNFKNPSSNMVSHPPPTQRPHSVTYNYTSPCHLLLPSHNPNRNLRTPFLSHLLEILQIPQGTHTPLPRPSRQRQHIIISEIFTNMKLQSDDKRLGGNAGFRGRQCRTWRMRCRRRGRKAGRQLPNVGCREVENLRMALDLVIIIKGICQRTFYISYNKRTSRIARKNASILPLVKPLGGEVCRSTVPRTTEARYATLKVSPAIIEANTRSATRCCVL